MAKIIDSSCIRSWACKAGTRTALETGTPSIGRPLMIDAEKGSRTCFFLSFRRFGVFLLDLSPVFRCGFCLQPGRFSTTGGSGPWKVILGWPGRCSSLGTALFMGLAGFGRFCAGFGLFFTTVFGCWSCRRSPTRKRRKSFRPDKRCGFSLGPAGGLGRGFG